MIALAAAASGASPGFGSPAFRSGSGFGEAWDASRSAPPPAEPPAQAPPAAPPANDAAAGSADPTAHAPGSKSKGNHAKTADADTEVHADATGENRSAAPAGEGDLAALQVMIAAMTGRASDAPGGPPAPEALPGTKAASTDAGSAMGTAPADAGPVPGIEPLILAMDGARTAPTAAAADPVPAGSAAPAPADPAVAHQLDLANDGAWLDQLTRDIARSADATGRLQFSLAPERLGRLDVQLAAGAEGTAIRLTAETRDAHRILSDAQPQLVAEARAQGLRVTETHVDLNDGGSGGAAHQSFGNQNSGRRDQPQRPIGRAGNDAAASAPAPVTGAADALYA